MDRRLAFAFVSLIAACSGRCEPQSPTVAPVEPFSELPRAVDDWAPQDLRADAYAGAAACRACHAEVFAAWESSPHGRAMAMPSPKTVLAPFAGEWVAAPGGRVTAGREGHRFVMQLDTPAGRDTHQVDLVIASGRQHQDYFERYGDGAYRLLPVFWSTVKARWISIDAYRPSSLDKGSPRHWAKNDLRSMQCAICHLSQGHVVDDEVRFVDLSINCESCHGPGRAHVRRMTTGEGNFEWPSLKGLRKEDDARLCGQCHGTRSDLRFAADPDDGLPRFLPLTLADQGFRPDGTQRLTNYQLGGHLVSGCYSRGAMKCVHCHDPHSGRIVSMAGESAAGMNSDRQCVVCHRNVEDESRARAHSHHARDVRCIDCHMSNSWILDDPNLDQRTSDHSIQIPRPHEAAELGTSNACATCHADEPPEALAAALATWGQTRALEMRPWVRALALGRRTDVDVAPFILALLRDPKDLAAFVQLSLVDLLARQPANPDAAGVLEGAAGSDDPHRRGLALHALILHDVDHASDWRRIAREDPNLFVRWQAIRTRSGALSEDDANAAGLDAAWQERLVEDLRRAGLRLEEKQE